MLFWSAIAFLVLALAGLSLVILLDVRHRGWSSWLSTFHTWQGTLGTVAGFLSAAGALMLSTAIQNQAELDRARRASLAIGQALAYEVERMTGPLQTSYMIARGIDTEAGDVVDQCKALLSGMLARLVDETPVYDTVLAQTLDFGDYNLALFTRVYAYFHDFRRELAFEPDLRCENDAAGEIAYASRIMLGGLSYYQLVAGNYPNVTPLQDGILPTTN